MDNSLLRMEYVACLQPFTNNFELIKTCWKEIVDAYSDDRRHYHTFAHLHHFSKQLDCCKMYLTDYPTVFLAMIYHDIVYFWQDGTNEERSALVAVTHLQQLGYPGDRIEFCVELIRSTKTHHHNENSQINYFIDADMSILGSKPAQYKCYAENIAKEYGTIPAFRQGRKRVLKNFLQIKPLFKTYLFFAKYEELARRNIQEEIDGINV